MLVQAYADPIDLPWVALHGARLFGVNGMRQAGDVALPGSITFGALAMAAKWKGVPSWEAQGSPLHQQEENGYQQECCPDHAQPQGAQPLVPTLRPQALPPPSQ